MGQIQSLDDLIGMILRRRWLIAVVTALGTLATVLVLLGRVPVWEAVAVLQVQSSTVSEDGTPAAGPSSAAAQRLQAIEQRLTTRTSLLEVIERQGLYRDLPLTDDEKVNLLRQSLRFQTVASVGAVTYGAAPVVSALLIIARADSGGLAARVANDFAQSILDAGAEGQTARTREALEFFREEEARVSAAMLALEAEMAAYRNAHADALPGQVDLRREEFLALEAELRGLGQEGAALEDEAARILARGALRETDRRQLALIEDRRAALAAQAVGLTARRDAIAAAMARVPEVERALAAFQRQLDQLQGQYDVVTRRLAEADTARKLEERQQAERFALLERAVVPEQPVSGGRRTLAAAGALASLMLALGLAFVVDHLRPVIRTAAQMERMLDLRPVVAIPEMAARPPRRRSGWRRWWPV
ncbi:MAG TPA: Wzz/FepE/Etk N-terminal domain-containing protein [Paracoccaceae bacterium]|nr:Wzz/FepE/Etk N-terminal domain-containing protein [Paracoccaceae bacterium]